MTDKTEYKPLWQEKKEAAEKKISEAKTFDEAFNLARKLKIVNFTWQGEQYHNRTKREQKEYLSTKRLIETEAIMKQKALEDKKRAEEEYRKNAPWGEESKRKRKLGESWIKSPNLSIDD